MPVDAKSVKLQRSFESQYGRKEGDRVYYATLNKRINEGRPIRVGESRHLQKKRKHHRHHTRKRKV